MNINEILFEYLDKKEHDYQIALKILPLLNGMPIREIECFLDNLKSFITKPPM